MFASIGINFSSAPIAVRDRVNFTDSGKIEFMQRAGEKTSCQMMILSTCNRCEIFYCCHEHAQIEKLFLEYFGEEIKCYCRSFYGKDAMAYLYRVAAGLESMVLGEDQILAQVRESWELSRAVGFSGRELNRIVLDAITCAKKIKTEFRISEVPLSVSYIGVKLLDEKLPIRGKNILVIGSGKTAALALRYLAEYEDVCITACSRNYSHAEALRSEFPNIKIVPFAERYEAMEQADIVLSATSAPHLVVKAEHIALNREMFFLDLASPRDIDPKIGTMSGMTLIDLDSLQEISQANMEKRRELSAACGSIVDAAVDETDKWLRSGVAHETISSLQELCREISDESYAYLDRKMELSSHDKKLLKKVLSASLLRLVREPIREINSSETHKQQEYSRVIAELFGFDRS